VLVEVKRHAHFCSPLWSFVIVHRLLLPYNEEA